MKRILLCVIVALTTLNAALGQKIAEKERIASVPDINGRATLLAQPEIPGDVSFAEDGNTLTLKIVVDTDGNVVSAQCSTTCPKALIEPAENAAMASKFYPLIVGGRALSWNRRF